MKTRRLTHAERVEFRDDVRAEGVFPHARTEESPLFLAEREDGQVGYGMTREEAVDNLLEQDAPDVEVETEATWEAFDANVRQLLRPA